MGSLTFKADLLPSTDLGYSLGSSDTTSPQRWKINGYEVIPLFRTNADFSASTPEPGAQYLDGDTHPVTNATEYGSFLTLPWRKTGNNNYSTQLLISSQSSTSSAHAYIRRNTAGGVWSDWSTILDNKNTTIPSTVPTLSWGGTSTLLTINGTDVQVKMPSNPNSNTQVRTYASSTSVELPLIGGNSSASTTATAPSLTSSYTGLYGAVPATNNNKATINPSTGAIAATKFICKNASNGTITNFMATSAANNIYFSVKDNSTSSQHTSLVISDTSIQPGSTEVNNINVGTASARFKGFYGNTLNLSSSSYGTTLPSSGMSTGQIFFQTSSGDNIANKITTTAATANSSYFIIGATAAGSQAPYIATANASGTSNTGGIWFNGSTGVLHGAAWNDFAEYRQSSCVEPGRVVCEIGNDSLELSTKRLQRGAAIISDTFGFAIGETDKAKTPIAVTGRVLAYPYESREEFISHIGWPVCSGPNGTVSIMTEEEEEKYPSRIIGIISAVPDYDKWGDGEGINVNNRVWIRIH